MVCENVGPLLQTWQLYEQRELVELVDPSLNGDFAAEEVCKFLKIGLLCTQDTSKLRPSMSTVVKMLIGEINVDNDAIMITKPGLITDFMELKIRSNPNPKPDGNPSHYNNVSSASGIETPTNSIFSFGTSSQAANTFTAICDHPILTPPREVAS